ncbi:MAG: NfeD family protein [Rhodospirillaceae bacterium]|nr:NfeD family protein [Rhodospirillaceae bacterium]
MVWWGWLVVGLLLMGAELTAVDAAFYLIFVGAAAICLGIIGLAGVTLPIWGQWLLFSILAIGSMVLFRQKLYNQLRGGLPGFENTTVDALVAVREDVPQGGQTRVRLRGTQWTAVNVGSAPIAAGADARVVDADGVDLRIEALPREPAAD